jgi:predicted Zn-dependent protease
MATHMTVGTVAGVTDEKRPQLLSEADCKDIAARITRLAKGGGIAWTIIRSSWTGNVRWARNQVSTSGDVHNNAIFVDRNIRGADAGFVLFNTTSERALAAAVRRAERVAMLRSEKRWSDLVDQELEPLPTSPDLFSKATYELDADKRAEAARNLAASAAKAGMLSAGYVAVSAHSIAAIDSLGRSRFFSYTHARYSVTVRDPSGSASGWAGADSHDWARIDGAKLSEIALDKCLRSRPPAVIEPGRYTAILEPQAVCDFVGQLFWVDGGAIDRPAAELSNPPGPFSIVVGTEDSPGWSFIGRKVLDERITISADPADPELGFPPFNSTMSTAATSFVDRVYHPATWIEHGVLKQLAYDRSYAMRYLGLNTGLPNSGAFRMTGGTTPIEEMIATTQRGLLVTRFDPSIQQIDGRSQLYRGYTRDGLWLIENGKITKPAKNLQFTESILGALNNVEQLGVPQRTFHPMNDGGPLAFLSMPQPVIVPPLKIRDFSFTALSDAV